MTLFAEPLAKTAFARSLFETVNKQKPMEPPFAVVQDGRKM